MNTTELKALAEKATPGPWIAAGPSFGAEHAVYYEDVVVDREGDEDDTFQVCQSPTGLEEQSSNDMEFIGAANPAAILSLIAALESAQDERRALLATEQNLREELAALKASIGEPVAIVDVVVPHLESFLLKHIPGADFPRVGGFLYAIKDKQP